MKIVLAVLAGLLVLVGVYLMLGIMISWLAGLWRGD